MGCNCEEMSSWDSEDLKFLIEIESTGFDMSTDEYEVCLKKGPKVVTVPKSAIVETSDGYMLCIDRELKKELGTGSIYLLVYANVPDTDFEKGYRKEVFKGLLSIVNNE